MHGVLSDPSITWLYHFQHRWFPNVKNTLQSAYLRPAQPTETDVQRGKCRNDGRQVRKRLLEGKIKLFVQFASRAYICCQIK